MQDFELEQLRRNPQWSATLRTYQALANEKRSASEAFDGWVPRVSQVPDVDVTKLSSIHGRLIAFGFLKFDLSDREIGMRYQLTPMARQALGENITAGSDLELAESA